MSSIDSIITINNGRHGQPVWVPEQHSLFWVEHHQQRLYQYHEPSKHITDSPIDYPILSLSPRINNGFIATLKDGIGLFDMNNKKVEYLSKPAPFAEDYEFTGSTVDARGNYWTSTNSTITNTENPQGYIYQLSPQLNLNRFSHKHMTFIAEPAFSKNGDIFYQSAKANRSVYATTLDDNRQPINTEVFCRIPKGEGQPYGLCVDSEDNLWVCHLGGGRISRYDTTGRRVDTIKINDSNALHATFGGENLDILFISTNSSNAKLTPPLNDTTGSIVAVKPGATGIKTYYFSG